MRIQPLLWILWAALPGLQSCAEDPALPLPRSFQSLSPSPAPALDPLCPEGSPAPQGGHVWVVFGDVGCGYCRVWLATLAAQAELLEAHGVQVIYTVGDAADCAQARRSARHVDFPVSLGSRRQSEAFGINPTPDTVFIRDGQRVGRMLSGTDAEGVRALLARLTR